MVIELQDLDHVLIRYKNVELLVEALPTGWEQYPRIMITGVHYAEGGIKTEPWEDQWGSEAGVIFRRT